ncbi:MAG: glycogen/starch synthase [Tannerellaceae bacterium]|jgi:glycosyltransferase involved in cell wall biosynthesis|nr:glycogen/starch synthase [Tannerellaceae bacterium]
MINKPDFIFESSWEVCNKVGGIYTVLSTKALTLQTDFPDNILFIGPDLKGNSRQDFEAEPSAMQQWREYAAETRHLKLRTGRWNVAGRPMVALVDYRPIMKEMNDIYYEMWERFGVDSLSAYGDYRESCAFAYAAGKTIESYCRFHELDEQRIVAVFNEWMLGMGLLYLRKHLPQVATMFVTHATTVGRSIAGNGKPLYSMLGQCDGNLMAAELNVAAKHSLEQQAARHADSFATVSRITADECANLIGKKPDAVVPNGFEPTFVPTGITYNRKRREARRMLAGAVAKLTGTAPDDTAFFVATAGRCEYRNKGLDVFIDAINSLRHNEQLKRPLVAFVMVPAWTRDARADLRYLIDNNLEQDSPLQMPWITHWINEPDHDPVLAHIRRHEFDPAGKVRIVYVPSYLNGADGIFDCSYYELLIGMDATVFPSYYEPWGYTPQESIAFGIPAVTTSLAGFGLWAQSEGAGGDVATGVRVIRRTDDNYAEVVADTASALVDLAAATEAEAADIRNKCRQLAERTGWNRFITHYYNAFGEAIARAEYREQQNVIITNNQSDRDENKQS